MKTFGKKISSYLLTFVMAFFLVMGVAFFNPYTASANDVTSPSEFCVVDGAAVRLVNDENGYYGIRFTAYAGEKVDGATYKMAIVPQEYVTAYNAATTQDDIITWLTKYAADCNGSIATAGCVVRSDNYYYASLTNIKYVNLNRKFVAIAYYEKDDNYTVGKYTADNAKSIVEVSKAAIESGKYDGEEYATEKAALQDYVVKGKNSADGVAFGAAADTSFITISNDGKTYNNVEDKNQVGEVTAATDSVKGSVYAIKITDSNIEHLELKYDKAEVAKRLAGYDTVKFSVKTPNTVTVAMFISYGVNMGSTSTVSSFHTDLVNEQWNEVSLSATQLSERNYITIASARKSTTTENYYYYITDIKAYTASEMASPVTAAVNALPEASAITVKYLKAVTEAKTAYDALSEKAKTYVSSAEVTKLNACVNALADYTYAFSSNALEKSNTMMWGDTYEISGVVDETYGDCIKISSRNNTELQFNQSLITNLKNQGYTKLVAYIYSGVEKNIEMILSGWGNSHKVKTDYQDNKLKANDWTLCYFDIDSIMAGNPYKYLIFYEGGGSTDLIISDFYAVK